MSIKTHIKEFLTPHDWVFGGVVEDYIRSVEGAKASNASRRLREMVKEGTLEVKYEQIEGKGPYVALYRIKKAPEPLYTSLQRPMTLRLI